MTAKEFLEQTSPNDKYGLRAELQKHRLRRMVEKEMEMYHEHKLKLLGIADVVVPKGTLYEDEKIDWSKLENSGLDTKLEKWD